MILRTANLVSAFHRAGTAVHLGAVHRAAVHLAAVYASDTGFSNAGAARLNHGSAWAVFVVGAGLILAGALGVILLRNPVHCALMLVVTLFGIALEFIDESADFLAVVQIIVYAGAIVILFLFVIMFLGVDRREAIAKEPFKGQKPIALVLGAVTLALLVILARVSNWTTGAKSLTGSLSGPGQDVQKLGQTIYTRYLLPFEMTSALLVIAIVAAVVLARTKQSAAGEMSKEEQEEVSSR